MGWYSGLYAREWPKAHQCGRWGQSSVRKRRGSCRGASAYRASKERRVRLIPTRPGPASFDAHSQRLISALFASFPFPVGNTSSQPNFSAKYTIIACDSGTTTSPSLSTGTVPAMYNSSRYFSEREPLGLLEPGLVGWSLNGTPWFRRSQVTVRQGCESSTP